MNRQLLWKSLKISLFILVIVLFIYYYLNNKESFAKLQQIHPAILLLIIVLQFGVIVTNILFYKYSLSFFGARIELKDNYKVIVRSSLINFFGFLQGGTGYRAFFAKRYFNINYKKFSLLFAVNTILVFAVSGLMGLIGVSARILSSGWNESNLIVFAFFLLTLSGIVLVLSVRERYSILQFHAFARLREIVKQWHTLVSYRSFVLRLFVVAVCQFVIMTIVYGMELATLGYNPDLFGLLIYTAVANFSLLVALTPSAIGIREGLLIFSQNSLGVSTEAVVLAGTMDRAVYFILLVIMAVSLYVLRIRPRS